MAVNVVLGKTDIYVVTPGRFGYRASNGDRTMPEKLVARRRLHRTVFIIAGIYNIGWGVYAVYDPQWLFRFAKMPLMVHPQIFACLGMVVGLYGIIYLEVARVPEHGWLLAAVGLLGKILGPIGLARLIITRSWPPATLVLCLTNDFIWWLPFALYLHDAWPHFRDDLKGVDTRALRD